MLKAGKYKNHAGAILEVDTPWTRGHIGGYLTLGGIWRAYSEPGVLGVDHYLVTEESMRDAGYELIEEAK